MNDKETKKSWFGVSGPLRPFIEESVDIDDDHLKFRSSFPWTAALLIFLSILGLAVSIFEALRFQVPTAVASTVLWGAIFVLLIIKQPRTGSALLAVLCVGVITSQATSIVQITSETRNELTAWDITGTALALVELIVVLNMPLRDPSFSRTGISQPFSVPSSSYRSPEDNLTLWQWMTVSWMGPLINIGYKRQLNDEDVWSLGYEFQHTYLHEAFRTVSGTVVRRLIKANWIDLAILTALAILELTADLSGPIILQQLLRAMEIIDSQKRPAISYTILMLLVRSVSSQSEVFSLWFGRRCYERSRGEMITMLHEKVLHRKIIGGNLQRDEKDPSSIATDPVVTDGDISADTQQDSEVTGLLSGEPRPKRSLTRVLQNAWKKFGSRLSPRKAAVANDDQHQPASMGKILNLMRNDVYETAQRFWEFQSLINRPLGLILSTILVWRLLGWACFVGVAVVLITQLLNAFFARMLLKWEKVRRKATDHKLQQISQFVEAIRHLRWYGWHLSMLENVMSARQKELNIRIVTFLWSSAIASANMFANGFMPVATFWAYTALAGRELRVDVAFPALQLFGMVQQNIREIPNLITVLLNAAVAVGRIEEFMSEPEIAQNDASQFDDRFVLKKASFAWPGVTNSVLHELDLDFPLGLTVVLGPVASGKTALMQALLGELDLQGGELVRPDAAVAYCAQTPWLQSMSIRENILFGSPYAESRYKRVLETCALLPDFASFEHGDLSPIGENGIGLSGGQKARVALARALYSTAKYLLLDDPLSALDQQTAEWIVAKCFKTDLLKERTTILVTHRTDLCQGLSQQVIQMSNGTAIATTETYEIPDGSLELDRSNSLPERVKDNQESAAVPEKFEDEEHREHGGIQFKVYWEYVKAGKLKWWTLVILACIVRRLIEYSQTWFLKEWGESYKSSAVWVLMAVQNIKSRLHVQSTPLSRLFDDFPDPSVNVNPWLLGFLVLVVIQATAYIVSQILMLVVTYTAGKNMFRDIMKRISNATFHFYDVTPVGRLMNRLTGDVGTIDGSISAQFLDFSWSTISWVTSVVIIASITPLFLVFSLTLTALYVFFFLRFLPSSQSLRRLEFVSLSPLMSNFGALLHGLTTVRAFHAQNQFQNRVIEVTDSFQKMDHFYWSLQGWLGYRFDVLSAISTFILTLLAIYSGLSPGLTAFVLVAAQSFVRSTHRICKQYGQLQLEFVSVERVVELLHLQQEDAGTINPPAAWPSPTGSIVFENVTMTYAPHLEPALKDISFTIPGSSSGSNSHGSNTAVIGRTGSGKSTLALALLATITPTSGRILIDGIDISQVSKQALRTRITFLAQDPILFPGTLRSNLDPLSEHTDPACSSVLTRIGGHKYNWTLDTPVDVGGKNLSQGQRQLVGLARAILRRSSLVIMDEATASIDYETSFEVQRVLREELVGSNVITIAHRAAAVQGVDWVCKLDKGRLVSFERVSSSPSSSL